ncbi:MAG: hypothetical protein ACR2NP_10470 [Pirellulaceae bacterium]
MSKQITVTGVKVVVDQNLASELLVLIGPPQAHEGQAKKESAMKRSRYANTARRNRHKGRTKAAQFARGLVLETLGVLALICLYFTLQSGSPSTQSDPVVNQGLPQAAPVAQPLAQITGYYASSWSEYHRNAVSDFHQNRLNETTSWLNWTPTPR